jgi:hypothetical protein
MNDDDDDGVFDLGSLDFGLECIDFVPDFDPDFGLECIDFVPDFDPDFGLECIDFVPDFDPDFGLDFGLFDLIELIFYYKKKY